MLLKKQNENVAAVNFVSNSIGLAFVILVYLLTGGCARVNEPKVLTQQLVEPTFNVQTEIKFDVHDLWNDHGILIVAGHTYKFGVSAEDWCDGGDTAEGICECGNGIPSLLNSGWQTTPSLLSKILKPMSFLRRCPRHPWYALVGVVKEKNEKGEEDHCFLIGKGEKNFISEATGRLFVFANDSYKSTYANNFGDVELTITRIK